MTCSDFFSGQPSCRWRPHVGYETALAALEYVNYYKFQVQHFDNWADFKRLMTGRGFRKAHMARDIAAGRATRAEQGRFD